MSRYQLQAFVTRPTWKVLSHNVAALAQHLPAISNRRRKRMGRASAAETWENLPQEGICGR
jgi:hypothetical protein